MEHLHGYALSDKLRKTRRAYRLTATEQALYYELIAICNGDGWSRVFKCSNNELCMALNINESTLMRARNTLIDAKLLFYRSGKSVREVGSYSFVEIPPVETKSFVILPDIPKQRAKTENLHAINDSSVKTTEFVVPSIDDIEKYCIERKNNISASKFFDYYSNNGWKTGGNPIKDWHALVRVWERNDFEKNNRKSGRAALAFKTANDIIW